MTGELTAENNMEISQDIFRFKHPFTALIAGPTGSGKTVLTRNLLKEFKRTTSINAQTLNVLWCHGQWQTSYEIKVEGVDIHYHDGLADESLIKKIKPHIIVIDDLMNEVCDNIEMSNIFTKQSHHMNISVIFIVQNMFKKGKEIRDIRLNCHQLILLKIPQDRFQVQVMGRQIFPSHTKAFNEAYHDATKEPYSYFNIDCSPSCPDNYRMKARLTAAENNGIYSPIIYVPK